MKAKPKIKIIEGFVIVQPANKMLRVEESVIQWSFGLIPTESWYRFADLARYTPMEASRIIQAWHDRGYRIKKATLTVEITKDEQ